MGPTIARTTYRAVSDRSRAWLICISFGNEIAPRLLHWYRRLPASSAPVAERHSSCSRYGREQDMHEPNSEALARAHHDCAERIRSAHESIANSRTHISDSKRAVARSLDLLRRAPSKD